MIQGQRSRHKRACHLYVLPANYLRLSVLSFSHLRFKSVCLCFDQRYQAHIVPESRYRERESRLIFLSALIFQQGLFYEYAGLMGLYKDCLARRLPKGS